MNGARRRGRALPLRLWLVLTVVAIVVGATAAEIALGRSMAAWQARADQSRLSAVRAVIGVDAARWGEPAWQRRAAAALDALDVDVRLVHLRAGGQGDQVFVTNGARRLLDTGLPAAMGGAAGQLTVDNARLPHTAAVTPAFQRIIIPDPTAPATGGPAARAAPLGVAFLWLTGSSLDAPSPWLWPLAAGGAILLVLAAATWLLGRAVLRPLAAMGRAAEGIAGGDLDVRLPPSRAREVAEVAAALEGMSAALRAALDRQGALEEERRRLEEERTLFVGAVAHDLRTPLFMLRGYLKGLENGVAATPEKRAHYVRACRAKADALERLIADLFDYTRLEYLHQEPERAPLDLGALVREAAEGVHPLAEAKGITLTLDAPTEPCVLMGDGSLLARVVGNLLDNALRHTPEGGRICVRWRRADGAVVFAIEDTGPGIAAHDLPHLFTPLYRGEASRNRQTGGAGLGLTIARRILRAHGGDLTAANGPTGGAVLTGLLPIERQAAGALPDKPYYWGEARADGRTLTRRETSARG